MKILLCTQRVECDGQQIDFSQGIGYMTPVLRQNGFEVQVLETDASAIDCDGIKKVLKESDYDVVGLGGLSAAFNSVEWMMEYVREERPEAYIILGGGLVTAAPELIFSHLMPDFGVIGEGERTIVELMHCLEGMTNPEIINGLVFNKITGSEMTEPRAPIMDLDALPYPSWDDFDIERMIQNASYAVRGKRRMAVLAGRSCPFLCSFCFHTVGNKYRKRSPENVIGEMKELVRRCRIDHFSFSDELFVYNEKWITDFCEMLIDEGLDITWESTGKPGFINLDILDLMKESGCVFVSNGFESGSDKILKSMRKKTTVKKAKETIRMYRQAGIAISGGIIVGDPVETKQTWRQTINFIKEMELLVIWTGYVTPYPGTYLYKLALKRGLITDEIQFHRDIANTTTLRINFTKIPDEELIKMRDDGMDEIRKHLLEISRKDFKTGLKVDSGRSIMSFHCHNCGTLFTSVVQTSSLRWNDVVCSNCLYQFLVDPYIIPHIREKIEPFAEKVAGLKGRVFVTPIGEHTRIAMKYFGLKPEGILDADRIRAQAKFEGFQCYHRTPEVVKELNPDYVVVTSELVLRNVIINDLLRCGISEDKIIAFE